MTKKIHYYNILVYVWYNCRLAKGHIQNKPCTIESPEFDKKKVSMGGAGDMN